jgi:hypothetical protein
MDNAPKPPDKGPFADLTKELQKQHFTAKQIQAIYDSMGKSATKLVDAHQDIDKATVSALNNWKNYQVVLKQTVEHSNKFLDHQTELVHLSQVAYDNHYDLFGLMMQEGDAATHARNVAEESLGIFKLQAELMGHTGEAADLLAHRLYEGMTVQQAIEDGAVEILEVRQKTNEFVKKDLELQLKVKERIKEISHHHDHIKDTIKQELAFAKELGNNPKLLGAFAAHQLGHHLAHANHEMHELVNSGMQAGEAIHVMRDNLSLMSVLGLSKVKGVNQELIAQFGTMNVLSEDQRHTIGEMATKFGLAEQEAVNLTMAISRMPGESAETATHFKETAKNVGKMSGVMPSQIMKEMAKNSGLMSTYSKGGAEGFAKAAASTKKMGVELSSVLSAAEKTLDFESSINAQMEASMLIGKDLNFDKMRAAALSGDANAILEEQTALMQQVGSLDEMNVLQKKALADAMGMSVEEMAKMNEAQEMQNKYFGENASALDNVIGSTMKYGGAVVEFGAKNGLMILTLIQAGIQYATMTALKAKDTAATGANTAATTQNTGATKLSTIANKISMGAQYAWNAVKGASIALWNSGIMVKIRDTASTAANTVAKTTNNVVTGISNFLANSWLANAARSVGVWAALKLAVLTDTIAKWANVGATTAQAGANATLATTQTTLAATGAAAGAGAAAAGTGIGVFGAAAAAGVPVILALGAAVLFVGAGIGIAAYGISLMADSFAKMPYENLAMLPLALMGMGAGLGLMALAGLQAMPIIGMLITLAAVSPALISLAGALGNVFGGGEKDKGGESQELVVLKEIKTAITDTLNAPIIVKIDGNAVATASRQATSTSGIDATIDK